MKGVVSSGSVYTSRAGVFALQEGGNAIDAMIASQLAAHVCEPMLTGFGGAGMATIRFEGEVYAVDMFTTMPGIDRSVAMPIMDNVILDFGTTTQTFTVGGGSIAVPTIPTGLTDIHRRFGTLPLEVLAKPAFKLCNEGFQITKACAYLLNLLKPIILMSQELSDWYITDKGETLKEQEFCKSIEMIQDLKHFLDYKDQFFNIGIYSKGVKTLHNSLLSNIDTDTYKTNISRSIPTQFKNWKIHSPNMPSLGGELIRFYQGWGTLDTSETLHHLTKSYRSIDGSRENYASNINSLGNTTHISTIDELGNAASITTSLGETAGIVLPGTGVAMNNFLGESDVVHPILMKHHGERMFTMCAPVILESENTIFSLGSGGSSRIPSAMIQVINRIINNQSVSDAVNSSRIHPYCTNNLLHEILLEPLRNSEIKQITDDNPNINLSVFDEQSLYFGGVHIAGLKDGVGVGIGDQRRSGCCLIYK